jgi:protein-tyrosine-phosphatase
LKTPHILVICTGNICRSSFAEIELRQRLAEHNIIARVRSAGTHAVPGNRCPDMAVAAGDRLGIDLRPHRATLLTPHLLEDMTHVIAMGEEHVEAVAYHQGGEPLVGWLENWSVADPYGGDAEVYDAGYAELRELCAEFAMELAEDPPR